MKKLFTIILSFYLILNPVAVIASEQSDYTAATHKDLQEGGYDFYAKQILQIATSAIGASVITKCPIGVKVPSIATFMAGSVVHIAAELLAAESLNNSHNTRMKDLEITESEMLNKGGVAQKQALEDKKKQEEDSLKFVESRILWLSAVSAIYWGSMAFAISEQITGLAAGVAAGGTSCAVTAAMLSAGCGPGYAGCYAGHMAACLGTMNLGTIATQAAFSLPAVTGGVPSPVGPGPGYTACSPAAAYIKACYADLNAYLLIAHPYCKPWTPMSGWKSKAIVAAVTMAYTAIAQKTAEGGGGVFNTIRLIQTLLPLVTTGLDKLVSSAYNYPIPRSITFGASGALATSITVGLVQRKKIHEDNIAKIQKVIDNFKLETDDLDGMGQDGVGDGKNNPNGSGKNDTKGTKLSGANIKGLSQGIAMKSCYSDAGESVEFSAKACAKPFRTNRVPFDSKNGIPALNSVGQMAYDLADSISAGDTDKAQLIAGNLASQAARMQNLAKDLQKKLNDQLKEKKEKPIDFDKGIKDQMASMQGLFNDAAGKNGLASTNLNTNGATLGDTTKEEKTAEPQVANVPTPAAPEAPAMPDLSAMGESQPEAVPEKVASLEDKLGDYETSENDIQKDPGVSIFKQLSNRYLLNYTRIFNRKEITPPLQAPASQEKK